MRAAKYKSYIICTSPRSGSTLLCKLLAETGKSGLPNSHFHVPTMSAWLSSYKLRRKDFKSDQQALRGVIDAARNRGSGDTGIFGLRMQQESFGFFMEQIAGLRPELSTYVEHIQAEFGRTLFIYLTRQNKLNQAISLVQALQTGLWHRSADGTELERTSPPRDPVYDASEIERNIKKLTVLDEAWKIWFRQEKIEPLAVTYDALSADPRQVLAGILERLGLNRQLASGIKPSVSKLADATNEMWAERFTAEREAPG